MYDRILVPVDGSEPSERAVSEAINLARSFDADLVFLYVVDVEAVSIDSYAGDVLERLEAHGKEAVANAEERADDAGVTAVTVVREGIPHRVITDVANEEDASMVVMGTHGRTGLGHVLLGSVTERVIRSSPVPVLTVRAETDGETDEE